MLWVHTHVVRYIFSFLQLVLTLIIYYKYIFLILFSYSNESTTCYPDIGSEEKAFGASPVYVENGTADPYMDDLEHELESSIANSIQLQAAVEPK